MFLSSWKRQQRDTSENGQPTQGLGNFLKMFKKHGGNESTISYSNDFLLNAGTVVITAQVQPWCAQGKAVFGPP